MCPCERESVLRKAEAACVASRPQKGKHVITQIFDSKTTRNDSDWRTGRLRCVLRLSAGYAPSDSAGTPMGAEWQRQSDITALLRRALK